MQHVFTSLFAAFLSSSQAFASSENFLTRASYLTEVLEKMASVYGGESAPWPGFHIWKEAIIISNNFDMTEFVAINIDCPAEWKCARISPSRGTISVVRGRAPLPLNVPGMVGTFGFLLSAYPQLDPNVAELFKANISKRFIYHSSVPFPAAPLGNRRFSLALNRDQRFLLQYQTIHEGFHMFYQLANVFGGESDWDFDMARANVRDFGAFCYPRSSLLVKDQLKLAKELFTGLAEGRSTEALKPKIRKFLELRKKRIQSFSTLERNCQDFDIYMERSEGWADYVTFKSLMDAGEVDFKKVAWYFNGLYLNDPVKSWTASHFVAYPIGALEAFLLDRLNPTQEWRDEIPLQKNSSLPLIIERYL